MVCKGSPENGCGLLYLYTSNLPSDAYAPKHGCVRIGPIPTLDVTPKSSHFCSGLRLFNPEILEQTYQGIERNGKRVKT
ncbi:hypothetical protein PIB30_048140 [Stylosanthes scabra]|uniref:Uncharacterized protein n=1 Tax=Stylosanthes scabra TaxID=79078 RepID=A0ABU6TGS4_9FABA|nr:hypothetical protein [Stylosanthes scabra]